MSKKTTWELCLECLTITCFFVVILAPYGVLYLQKRKLEELDRQLRYTRQEIGTIWTKLISDATKSK